MNSELAPTFIQQVGDNYILWFKPSNQYVIVENSLFGLIQYYLNSDTKTEFKQSLAPLKMDAVTMEAMHTEIGLFLKECNILRTEQEIPDLSFDASQRGESVYYQMDSVIIEVYYASEYIKSLIHPKIAYHSIDHISSKSDQVFDIYMVADNLCLFKDESIIGSYPLADYHLLQGKFAMLLLCAVTHTEELDWLGTFHASTVEKNDKAVMIIGDSGSGKSTFTALLFANNFHVLADDITPLFAKDSMVYSAPGGISIKAGAFGALASVVPDFDNLPSFYINPYKGYVKYIPATQPTDFLTGYSCQTMLCINYQKNAPTSLDEMSINEAMEILIPESWLAPQPDHAKTVLNWMKDIKFYKLTYSNYEDAILKFSDLFEA